MSSTGRMRDWANSSTKLVQPEDDDTAVHKILARVGFRICEEGTRI